MMPNLENLNYKLIINFFGISAFSLIAAVLLHELGHMLALFIIDGKIAHLKFHPFEGAEITYSDIPQDNELFVTFGGLFIGSLLGGFISAALWRFRNFFSAPFLMIGVAAFGGNGLMLVVGSLTATVGDVTKLISFGMAKGFLLLLGLIFLLIGFLMFYFLQSYLGIYRADSLYKRCYVFIGGLLPYIFCVLIYNLVYNIQKLGNYMTYVFGGITLAFGAAAVSKFLDSLKFIKSSDTLIEIQWRHVLFSFILGTGAIISCFLFLR